MIEIERFYKSFKFNFSEKDVVKKGNNEYLSLDNEGLVYIRNFCGDGFHYDVDEYYHDEELELLNRNIFKNERKLNSNLRIDSFNYQSQAMLIGSSKKSIRKHLERENFLKIGINDSLREYCSILDLYVFNNPYDSSLKFLPEKSVNSWPDGVFAYKSNSKFVSMYKGTVHGFNIPFFQKSSGLFNAENNNMFLEDHRSSILSAFNLVYYLRIKNLELVNTENYIREERPGTVYIKKGIYMYPQQIVETSIISAGIYWLNKYGLKVFTHDSNFDFINNLNVINEKSEEI